MAVPDEPWLRAVGEELDEPKTSGWIAAGARARGGHGIRLRRDVGQGLGHTDPRSSRPGEGAVYDGKPPQVAAASEGTH